MDELINCDPGCNESTDKQGYEDNKFKTGQIWKYNTRSGEENSTLIILKVEKHAGIGVVAHIYVNGLKLKNPQQPCDFSEYIKHLPISKEALLISVTTLVSSDNMLPDFEEGYNIWKYAFDNNKAGIFSLSVYDAVKSIEAVLNK